MNKEKIEKIAKQTFIENVMSNFDSALIFTYIQNLEQENKQLKDNWNELKEYMNNNIIYDEVGMKIFDVSKLEEKIEDLEILKGDSNE